MAYKYITPEEKSKAYDEALERAMELQENSNGMILKKWLWKVFPELAESEDERIRKVLLNDFKNNCSEYYCEGVNRDMIIAWLEKQGEHTHKVEHKFHEGDWVVYMGTTAKILDLQKHCYVGKDINDKDFVVSYCNEYEMKKWDISDAKDGDVLIHNNRLFIFKGIENDIVKGLCSEISDSILNFGEPEYDNDYYPATKEQRDTLLKAMTDAGYTFDFEKKELKKIEQKSQRMISTEAKEASCDKPTDEEMKELLRTEYEKGRADTIAEMKSSWSEEDEAIKKELISYLAKKKSRETDEYAIWLKSLKQRIGE